MTQIVFFLALFTIVGAILTYGTFLSAREWSTLYCLKRRGISVRAEVIEVVRNTQNRGTQYLLSYGYQINGVVYENRQQINSHHYKEFTQVNAVTVNYFRHKPHISRLGGHDFDNTSRNLTSYAAFAGILIIPPLIIFWLICFTTYYFLLYAE